MSQSRVAPMPDSPPPIPSLQSLHRTRSQTDPREILDRAQHGDPPEWLMDFYGISPKTFRRILSGYRPFERLGGSKKIWEQYRYLYEAEIRAMWKPQVIW